MPFKSDKKRERIEVRMSVKEYARMKRVSEKTVYRKIERGILKSEQPAPHYPHEIIVFF
ncbi:MAG: hypothetical protein KGH93_03350 [Patescibacteria group bacterium]|nr:hypothetical protein [Patescibacteria group bacterium]